jgi:hypothetical protein
MPKPKPKTPSRQLQKRPKAALAHRRRKKREPLTLAAAVEKVLILGDLAELQPEQRIQYYNVMCKSLRLNPFTRPFDYIVFREKRDDEEDDQQDERKGKLTLYANKNCAEQLRMLHHISVVRGTKKRVVSEEFASTELDVMDKTGRTDSGIGIVYLHKYSRKNKRMYRLTGQQLANAIMKSETKAKRRATLSICGLGFMDELDLEGVDVIGGVTKDGRIWQYDQLPEKASQAGTDVSSEEVRDSLRSRGLWCDEHSCARSSNHNSVCETSRKAMEQMKTPARPPQQAPAKASAGATPAQPSAPIDIPANPSGPAPTPKYELTIDWVLNPNLGPVLTSGETDMEKLGILLADLKPPIRMMWGTDSFWHVLADQIPRVLNVCVANGFTVKEIGKAEKKKAAVETGIVSGVIERVNTGMAGKVPVKHVTVLLEDKTKPTFSCFDKKWFEALDAGLGKQAVLITKQNKSYINIIGARKIGSKEWLDDGTPAIQRKDQEPGRTLF